MTKKFGWSKSRGKFVGSIQNDWRNRGELVDFINREKKYGSNPRTGLKRRFGYTQKETSSIMKYYNSLKSAKRKTATGKITASRRK